MKRKLSVLLAGTLLLALALAGCGNSDNGDASNAAAGSGSPQPTGGGSVVIYTSAEDFRNEYMQQRLKEEFPNLNITVQYESTGDSAAKLKAAGADTECDIIVGLDSAYLSSLGDMLEDLSAYDYSAYLPEMIPATKNYLPWERFSGCIILNKDVMESRNLPVPGSYDDLLDPVYKGLISMPNPKTSGTGYFFLQNLVNTRGEDAAFEYFDGLAQNILQFTTSGSGPVNALVMGEVAIGLGMTFQAVNQINEGVNLEILYFEEGAPYSTTGSAAVAGRLADPDIKAVFDFLNTDLVREDKELFSPELIFVDQTIAVENYPDVPYATNMQGMDDVENKDRLLARWLY